MPPNHAIHHAALRAESLHRALALMHAHVAAFGLDLSLLVLMSRSPFTLREPLDIGLGLVPQHVNALVREPARILIRKLAEPLQILERALWLHELDDVDGLGFIGARVLLLWGERGRGVASAELRLVGVAVTVLIDGEVGFLAQQDLALPAGEDGELLVHADDFAAAPADDKGRADFSKMLLERQEMPLEPFFLVDEVFFFEFAVDVDEYAAEVLHVFLRFGRPGPAILGQDELKKLVVAFDVIMRLCDSLINAFSVAISLAYTIGVNRLKGIVGRPAVLLPPADCGRSLLLLWLMWVSEECS